MRSELSEAFSFLLCEDRYYPASLVDLYASASRLARTSPPIWMRWVVLGKLDWGGRWALHVSVLMEDHGSTTIQCI